MRITVTVVVIMFELTGALTYILPTMVRSYSEFEVDYLMVCLQIVLLVTKAVGDLLGVRGIAEEAIRFNGYPFLEKDDHVYDAPGQYPLLLVKSARLTECCSITSYAEGHLHPSGHRYDTSGCR